jgi:hydroxyethylthiazole kinase-like uncharacterized protein yjeF
VLGVVAGSQAYPGAAVLSVEAAARSGVGMIRYIGTAESTRLVLERRPEVVTGDGRVDAYVIGSGIDPQELRLDAPRTTIIDQAFASSTPLVIDAGGLDWLPLPARPHSPLVITPHFRELAKTLSRAGLTVDAPAIEKDPGLWASRAADHLGVTVLLKGSLTHVCSPADERGTRFHAIVTSANSWMATAGTGDVLAGILGALVATHADAVAHDVAVLGPIAATAAFVHVRAGEQASGGGPLVALDVAEAIPDVIAHLL